MSIETLSVQEHESLPKIRIAYSPSYDLIFHYCYKRKYGKGQDAAGAKYAKMLQRRWDRLSNRILSAIQEVSGLRWRNEMIVAYVVKYVPAPFSDPLTLPMPKDMMRDVSFLAHEITHRLVDQNRRRIRLTVLLRKYKNQSIWVKNHILIHAILMLANPKIYGRNAEKHLKYERWWEWHKSPLGFDYKKSWTIVKENGPEKIIEELIKKY